jgi:hypothetical protein
LILEDQATGPSLPDIITTGLTLSEEKGMSSTLTGLVITQDGTKMYYPNDSTAIYQRTMSTPYDVSTAGTESLAAVPATVTGGPTGTTRYRTILFNPDGTSVFLLDFSNQGRVYEYHLTTPFDVTEIHNATYDNMFWLGNTPVNLTISNDGGYAYFMIGTGLVRRYTLTTPWTFEGTPGGASYDYDSEQLGTVAHGTTYGALVSADGTRMIATRSSLRRVQQYTLATPYDTRTAEDDGYVAMTGGGSTTTALHQVVESDGLTTRDEFYMAHYGSTYMVQRYTY